MNHALLQSSSFMEFSQESQIIMYLRESPPEDHPTLPISHRGKNFFPILLSQTKGLD